MSYEQFRPRAFNVLPEVVKNLLIINGLFFLATMALESSFHFDLVRLLGLFPVDSQQFRPFQFVTHMFMHGGFTHIFFNMFALWMFGSAIENYWGGKRFLVYYLVTGFGAALMQVGVNEWQIRSLATTMHPADVSIVLDEGLKLLESGRNYTDPLMGQLNLLLNTPMVGASGAVFGVLLAFGMMFPNSLIYIYFLFPIKAKYLVMIYGAMELYSAIQNDPTNNIAHFAHVGGMLFGYLLIRYWKSKGTRFY